jgi:hypothetical protein
MLSCLMIINVKDRNPAVRGPNYSDTLMIMSVDAVVLRKLPSSISL